MKGLKKVALASAIAAVSAGAQAELKALDDSAMGELTGQAGLTIDVETEFKLGEFAYHDTDGGFVVIQDVHLKANENDTFNTTGYATTNTLVDNFRMTIDVAGAGEGLAYGMSEMVGLATIAGALGNTDTTLQALAGAVDATAQDASGNNLAADTGRVYGDGDLVIHFGFTDAFQKGGGTTAWLKGSGTDLSGNPVGLATATYDQARAVVERAVDYQLDIGVLGIASSGYTIGSKAVETAADGRVSIGAGAADTAVIDTTPNTTALLSGISIKGFQGPDDLHIANNGNGFGGGAGVGDADSKITWGDYFKITDLDVYIDIAGVQISDLSIQNNRGDLSGLDGTSAFGFAHSERTIYAVNEDVIKLTELLVGDGRNHLVDGVAINTRFKGDMDIGALSFGDDGISIGSIYLTDIESTTNWTISAH